MAEKPLTALVLAVESALPAIICNIHYDVHGSPFVKIQPEKLSPYLVYTTAVEILGTLDENQEQIHLSLLSYKRELIEQQSLRLFDKDAQTGMSTYLLYIKKKLCDVNFAFCAGTTEEQIFSNFNSVKKTDLVLCLIEKSLDSPSKLVFRSRECKIVQPESELNPDTRQCKDCLDFFSNFFISKGDKDEAEANEKLTCPYMYCGKTFSYQSSYQRHLSSHSLSPNVSILSSSDITGDLDDREEDDESDSIKFDPEDEDRLKSDDQVPALPVEAKVDEDVKKDEVKDEPTLEESSNLIKGVTRLKKRKRGRPKIKKDKKKELSIKTAGSFHCETCGKNFQYEKSFKKHMDTHSSSQDLHAIETENIPTRVSNKLTNKKAKSVKFVKSETPVCEVCSISFEDQKTFITHMKKNHRLALSCEECGQRFTFKRSLEIHRRRIHTSRNCSLCNIQFSSRKEFLIHDHHVHKNVPEPCYVCGKHIKRASMSQHLKLVHHGEEHRKHLCNICGNAYKTRTDLTRHYTKHTGERLYVCQTCGKGHRWKDEMYKCENTHAGIYKFPCHHPSCNKKFQTRFRLDLHLRTHDGRRPFQCPGCSYTCARKDNLATHVKKVHKMGLEDARAFYNKDYNVMGGTDGSILNKDKKQLNDLWPTNIKKEEGTPGLNQTHSLTKSVPADRQILSQSIDSQDLIQEVFNQSQQIPEMTRHGLNQSQHDPMLTSVVQRQSLNSQDSLMVQNHTTHHLVTTNSLLGPSGSVIQDRILMNSLERMVSSPLERVSNGSLDRIVTSPIVTSSLDRIVTSPLDRIVTSAIDRIGPLDRNGTSAIDRIGTGPLDRIVTSAIDRIVFTPIDRLTNVTNLQTRPM